MPSQYRASRVRAQEFGEYWATERTKPSIAPPFTSILEWDRSCGPPWLIRAASWNGRTHLPSTGSGMHTVGFPFVIGMPFAPGNVPK